MTAPFVPGPAPYEPVERPIRCEVYESDNLTKVGDLTTDVTGSREFREELAGIAGFGSGSLTVPTHVESGGVMVSNPECGWLQRGRIVRWSLDGEDREPFRVKPRRQSSVSPEGFPGMSRTVQMEGILSEWDDAVLPPDPGATFSDGSSRRFGWMSREADTSGLSAPTVSRPVIESGYLMPDPWIDVFGAVFSTSSNRFFVLDQTVAAETMVAVDVAVADRVTIYLNGEVVGQTDLAPATAWDNTSRLLARIPAGTHRWAFSVESLPDQPEPRWTATCFALDSPETGHMNGGTILWRTGYSTGVTLYPWKAASTPWGVTAAQVIESVRAQVASEQGLLGDWTVTAVGSLPLIPEVVFSKGAKCGTEFLIGMAKSWCDLSVAKSGKTLYVHPWRERGNFHTSPGVMPVFSDDRFAPAPGVQANVSSLSHEERIR